MRTPGRDRSPGEFYQLDMEMAFATQEDVFAVLEDVLPPIFAKFGTYNRGHLRPLHAASPIGDAMENYGSDKPDLRIDLTVQGRHRPVRRLRASRPCEGQTVVKVRGGQRLPARPASRSTRLLARRARCMSGAKAYWFKHGRKRRAGRRHRQVRQPVSRSS